MGSKSVLSEQKKTQVQIPEKPTESTKFRNRVFVLCYYLLPKAANYTVIWL